MFERFTERARQVVLLGQAEARDLCHNYIGTEHLLLGLLREEEGIAARALKAVNITAEQVRGEIVRIVGRGEVVTTGQIPFTSRAKKVLELALREALSLGHNYIGTEHILLGLVRENGGVAARILLDFDADAEKIRDEVIRSLSGPRAQAAKVRRWHRRGDVDIGQVWERNDELFPVVAIVDTPTVVVENVADGKREAYLVESPNFAEFHRLAPTEPGGGG